MAQQSTLALVGAVGGAGTTRTAVECGATLARAGLDVAVLDAAFATQGLAEYVPGRIDPDLTAVVAEEVPLEDALVPVATDLPGKFVAAPARAPFERVARAKTAGAADRFERQIAAASLSHDAVLVDTPPVAANQAVAAVSACDRVALVAPDTRRGTDGVARMTGVLEDVGAAVAGTVATVAGEEPVIEDAVARLPETDATAPGACPTCVDGDATLGPPVAAAVEALLDVELGIDIEESGGVGRFLPGGS